MKDKKCNKECMYYVNGMCFKKNDDVKIVKENTPCKWDKDKKEE